MKRLWWRASIVLVGLALVIFSLFVYHKYRIDAQEMTALRAELDGHPMVGAPYIHGFHMSVGSWHSLFLLTLILGIIMLISGGYSVLRLKMFPRL